MHLYSRRKLRSFQTLLGLIKAMKYTKLLSRGLETVLCYNNSLSPFPFFGPVQILTHNPGPLSSLPLVSTNQGCRIIYWLTFSPVNIASYIGEPWTNCTLLPEKRREWKFDFSEHEDDVIIRHIFLSNIVISYIVRKFDAGQKSLYNAGSKMKSWNGGQSRHFIQFNSTQLLHDWRRVSMPTIFLPTKIFKSYVGLNFEIIKLSSFLSFNQCTKITTFLENFTTNFILFLHKNCRF